MNFHHPIGISAKLFILFLHYFLITAYLSQTDGVYPPKIIFEYGN